MSADGSVIVGYSDSGSQQAFVWTQGGGMQVIGQGSTIGSWTGIAMDIADNGTIVGFDAFLQNRRAWIKPPGETELVVAQTA